MFSLKFQSYYYILMDILLFSKHFLERSLRNDRRALRTVAVNTYSVLYHLHVKFILRIITT